MPVLGVATLDRLIETSEKNLGKGEKGSASASSSSEARKSAKETVKSVKERKPLYSIESYTPASFPEHPRSPSPSSRYIVNFKGRGGHIRRLQSDTSLVEAEKHESGKDTSSSSIANDFQPSSSACASIVRDDLPREQERMVTLGQNDDRLKDAETTLDPYGVKGKHFNSELQGPRIRTGDELRRFFEMKDWMRERVSAVERTMFQEMRARSSEDFTSLKNNPKSEFENIYHLHSPSLSKQSSTGHSTGGEEFYDASENPGYASSDDGSQTDEGSGRFKIYDECTSLSQLELEIERRKKAEASLETLIQQHHDIAQRLSKAGLSLPGVLMHDSELKERRQAINEEQSNEVDWSSEINERLAISRLVASSIAKGAVKAEVEEEFENELANKNREVARLRDKVVYYELLNHEISQRNQEAIEISRRRRRLRQRKLHWMIGCTSAAVCIGVSALLVSKYFPWEAWQTTDDSASSAAESGDA